jgi:hypothetical protein
MKVVLIPADVSKPVALVDTANDMFFSNLAKLIGCEYIERVTCSLHRHGLAIVVDEEGLLKPEPRYNPRADLFYGGNLYGDALVVAETREDFIDLPDPDAVLQLVTGKIDQYLGGRI